MNKKFVIVMAGVCVSACSSADHGGAKERTGDARAVSSALVASQGVLPYPIKLESDGKTPRVGPDGKRVVAWSGSLPDLMAADAWAACTTYHLDSRADTDGYLLYLAGKMNEDTSCGAANDGCAFGGCPGITRWAKLRGAATCNADTSSGAPQSVAFTPRDTSAYQINTPAGIPESAYRAAWEAQVQVDTADMNLCMAQRMRESMVTSAGLLLAAPDSRELLEIIRERVQLAMLQYGLLGVAFTSEDRRTLSTFGNHQILPILRAFADDPGNGDKVARIGDDFAAAVQMEVQVTEELGQVLARSASARIPLPAAPPGRADQDFGPGSWRERILRLMYGGDPLYGFHGDKLWQSFSGTRSGYQAYGNRDYVSDDSRSPEVDALLAFARSADALYLRADADPANEDADLDKVDAEASAVRLYRAVEASLREPSCMATATAASTCEEAAVHAGVPDPVGALGDAWLWTKHKISLDHARALVRRLGQAIPKYSVRYKDDSGQWVYWWESEAALHFTGAHALLDPEAAARALPGAPAGVWYHVSPAFVTLPRADEERATPYLTSFFMPTWLDIYNVETNQGFVARWRNGASSDSDVTVDGSARMRVLGAVGALAAARDALFTAGRAAGNTGSATAQRFVASANAALPVIEAAIGTRSAAVRAALTPRYVNEPCTEWGNTGGNFWCWEDVQAAQGDVPLWQVTVQTTPSDAYTTLVLVPSTDATTMAATAASDPSFRSYGGQTRASIFAGATTFAATDAPAVNGRTRRSFSVPWSGDAAWLFLKRTGVNGAADDYQLLTTDAFTVSTDRRSELADGDTSTVKTVYRSLDGRWVAGGGALSLLARRAWTVQSENWSQPKYDGFGDPVSWFPPTDPTLYASAGGDNVVAHYLASAHEAAAAASGAVGQAITELLKEQSDSITLDDARQRAQQIVGQEKQSLCGAAVTSCTDAVAPKQFDLFGDPAAGGAHFVAEPSCAGKPGVCDAYNQALHAFVPASVTIPAAVWARRWEQSAPSFDELAGGSLQKLFIQQWESLSKLRRSSYEASNAVAARLAGVAAAQAAVDASTSFEAFQCAESTLQNAVKAGYSTTFDADDDYSASTDGVGSFEDVKGKAWSAGPLWSQIVACRQAATGIEPAKAQAAAALVDVWSTAAEQLTRLASIGSEMRSVHADVSKAASDSALATARANLEAKLAAHQLVTRFGTYRRFHSLDMWRAQALLEVARRYAVTARRAIESRYVVDLSTMYAAEHFVAAPAQWADTIYDTDLDARGAVGLSVAPDQSATNPTKIDDYVSNLNNFVNGFAFARPTAVVHSDTELLVLAAPDARENVTLASGDTVQALAAGARAWTYFCPETGAWVAHPAAGQAPAVASLADACGPGKSPSLARLTFGLDGWGRLNDDTARDPLKYRYNARWNRFAINLKGTGVKDCSRASAGAPCNPGDNFLRYSLSAVGPGWVTNYDQQWRVLGVPVGRVEEAKALASDGTVWSIPSHAWGLTDVDSIARTELVDRPVSGTYQLDLAVGPEVSLSAIDYVQLLHDTSYWVKQQ